MGAQELGDFHGALDNPGIPGCHGLFEIIVQSYIEAIALPGNLGCEQSVKRISGKLSINDTLLAWCRVNSCRGRCGCWVGNRTIDSAAADQQAEGQNQGGADEGCRHE